MKKALIVVLSSLSLSVVSVAAQEREPEFRKGEWQLSPFATYVDKSGDKWGVGTALTYFLTKRLGIGAATYWTDFSGTFFDNVEGEAYFRLAQFDRVAPYAVGSIGYQFDAGYWFETLGAGVDVRVFKKLTAFGDIQYRIANNSNSQDGIFLRLGARFSF